MFCRDREFAVSSCRGRRRSSLQIPSPQSMSASASPPRGCVFPVPRRATGEFVGASVSVAGALSRSFVLLVNSTGRSQPDSMDAATTEKMETETYLLTSGHYQIKDRDTCTGAVIR